MSVYELETFETPTQIAEDAYIAGHKCAMQGGCVHGVNNSPYESSNAFYVWQKGFVFGWSDARLLMGNNRDMVGSNEDSHAA